MKYAIYPEKHGTPTVTSEDSRYPILNLINNDYRKKTWKAQPGVQSATIRLPISEDAEAVTLHKTNAETAICTITLDSAEKTLSASGATDEGGGLVGIPIVGHGYTVGQSVLLNDTANYDGVCVLPSQAAGGVDKLIVTATYAAETFAGTETACIVAETVTHVLETTDRTYDRFWQKYTEQTNSHHATIKLTAGTGETVEAGILRAGGILTFANPQYGATQAPKDYSIKKQLRNGAVKTKKLEIVRSYSYSMDLKRETKFNDLMDLYFFMGPNPIAMLIDDAVGDDNMWALFGTFSEPKGTHSNPLDSVASISVLEAV